MALSSNQLQAQYAPPLNQNWTRRAYHASVVVGDWVYLHMGEVAVGSEPFRPNLSQPQYKPFPVNGTLSLDISKSWTDPRNLQFQAFEKPKSGMYNFGALWYDEKRKEVFSFGGEESYLDGAQAPYADLSTFKLTPTDNGSGTWVQNSSDTTVPFTQPGITRPFGGASAQSNTTAFYLSGYASSYSSDKTRFLTTFVPTPGLITYEFATGAWTNTTIDPALSVGLPNSVFEWGGMEYLPGLGPNGMLVVWGGDTSSRSIYRQGIDVRPMDSVTLHDPVSKQWYTQQIAGTTPSPRSRFCSVSASDPRSISTANKTGTHEIYMYGGYDGIVGSNNQQYDEIWVLSLPGFTWQQLDSSHKSARIGHTCHLVGKRQLLSIGGADPSLIDPWSVPDYSSWNGLGVYDLSAASWSAGFNVSADPYQRPGAVQSYYDANGAYPQTWTQPSLQALIQHNVQLSASSTSSSNSNGSPSANSTAPATSLSDQNSTSSPPSPPTNSPAPHTAIIAGATIGGAIAALLPFLLLYLLFRNRFKHTHPLPTELQADTTSRKELPGPPGKHTSRTAYSRGRSTGRSRPRGPPVELDAGHAVDEMGAPTPAHVAHARRERGDDYFNHLRSGPVDPRAREMKSPVLVTPGVKEMGGSPTPPRYPGTMRRPPLRP